MCKGNYPVKKIFKNIIITECVTETPHIKKKKKTRSQHGKCQRNSPDKCETNTGCVRETPKIKKKIKNKVNKARMGYVRETPHLKTVIMGCVRETPHIKLKPARDV